MTPEEYAEYIFFRQYGVSHDSVLRQCEIDAIEYFRGLGIDLSDKNRRRMLSKETKARVIAFLVN